jgi:hypothetical protein
MNNTEWFTETCLMVANRLGISYGDALDIMEAQSFLLSQCWGKDLSSEETATKIINTGA